jgi:hypothetical protein
MLPNGTRQPVYVGGAEGSSPFNDDDLDQRGRPGLRDMAAIAAPRSGRVPDPLTARWRCGVPDRFPPFVLTLFWRDSS